MNMPTAKARTIMNRTMMGAGFPGPAEGVRSECWIKLKKSFIADIILLLWQHASVPLELLRVNAGSIFTNGSLPEVENFDQIKHPARRLIVKFQFQNDPVPREWCQVGGQIGTPATLGNLQPAAAVITAAVNVTVKGHPQFFIVRRLVNFAVIGDIYRSVGARRV